jgi:hypothetical protein
MSMWVFLIVIPRGFVGRYKRFRMNILLTSSGPAYHILNLIVIIIFGEENAYKLRSTSYYNFYTFVITFYLFGTNILLSTLISNILTK